MKSKYPWISGYSDPHYWDKRTPLILGMPKIVNFYINLNDNKVRSFLKTQKGNILDVGCGDGRFLGYADVGVDFSKGMLCKAKKAERSLLQASILKLPFRRGVFSVVFSVDVLLHIKPSEQKIAMAELQRVAKKVYTFLGEHRTVFPLICNLLINSPFKPKRLVPYFAWLLAFPFDRIRSLKVNFHHNEWLKKF